MNRLIGQVKNKYFFNFDIILSRPNLRSQIATSRFQIHFSPNFLPPTSSEALLHRPQAPVKFAPLVFCEELNGAVPAYSSAFSITFQCCLSSTQKCKLLHILYLKGIIFQQITESFVTFQFYLLFQVDRNRIGFI